MTKNKKQIILLKISGESLKGDFAQIRKFETISYILSQETIILLSVES